MIEPWGSLTLTVMAIGLGLLALAWTGTREE